MGGQSAFTPKAIVGVGSLSVVGRTDSGTGKAGSIEFGVLYAAWIDSLPTSEPVETGAWWFDESAGFPKQSEGIPPTIDTQPQGAAIEEGETATFTVVATNAESYQWQLDSGSGFEDIEDADSASYTTPSQTLANDGDEYRLVVFGPGGSITSNAVAITIDAGLISGTLAPAQSTDDYGYSSGSYGAITGTTAIASVIANDTDMRLTPTSGTKIDSQDSIRFLWDGNEVILNWDASGYYVSIDDDHVDHEVFRDHFSRQLGTAQDFVVRAPSVLSPRVEVWEGSAGSLQGAALRILDNGYANDDDYLLESQYPDAFGGDFAWGQYDEAGNSFLTVDNGLTLENGGTIACVGEKVSGDTLSPQYDNTVGARVYFTDTTATLRLLDPTVSVSEPFAMSAGQHAMVLTIAPDGLGDATYTVYVDGVQVLQTTSALRTPVSSRIWITDACRISQLIRDESVWSSTQIANHYNAGSFQRFDYGSSLVGVVHGDSLTNTPNRNTWHDTMSGRRYTTPSWVDYLRELHGKLILGDGYESRKIESADTTLKTIQRYSHLPAGTRHFLYLGINNLVISPIAANVTELQSQLEAAISTVESQGHEAVLFCMPPVDTVTTDLTNTAAIYAAYDSWLTTTKAGEGYRVIDPKDVLANTGSRVLKSIYNTTKAGAERPNNDDLHYNNYGHKALAQHISDTIDGWE